MDLKQSTWFELCLSLGLEDKPLYSIKEAEALLGVSRCTLWRWRNEGLLATIKQPGGGVLVEAREIKKHFEIFDGTEDRYPQKIETTCLRLIDALQSFLTEFRQNSTT